MRRTDIRIQFASYLVVGGIAFLTELATFLALLAADVSVIPASIASFIVATAANYALSRRIAFARKPISGGDEIARFLLVAGVGLVLNTGVVWTLLLLGLPATIAKVAAVAPVLAWNFLGRRLFVFTDVVPTGTWQFAERLIGRPARSDAPRAVKAESD